jgi:hypothetical protein
MRKIALAAALLVSGHAYAYDLYDLQRDSQQRNEQNRQMWQREEDNRNRTLQSGGIGSDFSNRNCGGIGLVYGRCN